MITPPSAAAAQLGSTLLAIPWTTRTSGWHCPRPQKGRREEKQAPQAQKTVEHVIESGATWSHLQESLCLLMSYVYSVLRQYRDNDSGQMN